MARLSTCRPTVRPICASSPAAWTAVVTTSVVLERPSRGGSGRCGGGGVGRAAAGFAAARGFGFAAVFAAPAFFVAVAFVPLVFLAAVGFAFAVAVGSAFVVAVGFVAAAEDVVGPRWPPMRAGRLERRLPRTLGSGLVAFFGFFLAVFWAMRSKVARARVATGYSDAATRAVTALVPKK